MVVKSDRMKALSAPYESTSPTLRTRTARTPQRMLTSSYTVETPSTIQEASSPAVIELADVPAWELPNVDAGMLEDLQQGVVCTLDKLNRMNSMALSRFDLTQDTVDRTEESRKTLKEMSHNCMRYQNEACIAKEAAMQA